MTPPRNPFWIARACFAHRHQTHHAPEITCLWCATLATIYGADLQLAKPGTATLRLSGCTLDSLFTAHRESNRATNPGPWAGTCTRSGLDRLVPQLRQHATTDERRWTVVQSGQCSFVVNSPAAGRAEIRDETAVATDRVYYCSAVLASTDDRRPDSSRHDVTCLPRGVRDKGMAVRSTTGVIFLLFFFSRNG